MVVSKIIQPSNAVIIIAVAVLIIAIAICIALVYRTHKRIRQIVLNNSTKYIELEKLNKEISFYKVEKEHYIEKHCSSKQQFDRFNGFEFLVGEVMREQGWFVDTLSKVEKNKNLLCVYKNVRDNIPQTSQETIIYFGIRETIFWSIEDELFNKAILKPITEFRINVCCYYISPKGKNRYRQELHYSTDDIKAAIIEANRKKTYKETQKYQRSLMSDSLRYKILQRDGFRCCICGASSADGAMLEVDHIFPVSKGGKTVESNLRTLCKSCNRGKRDSYNYSGVN